MKSFLLSIDFFISEVEDQVMVNFQHGHPDRPFVMGGMFHGGTGLGVV
ncbi:phage baseplate assembly protein V [Chryseobacterium polytrichastri]